MIRILHVVSSLNKGGVGILLNNYYSNIDRSKITFDFIVHGFNVGALETEFREKGARIFHVTPKKKSILQNALEIKKIIKEGKYDVVHAHQNLTSIVPLYYSKKYKVRIRIAHSHGIIKSDGFIKEKLNKIVAKKIKKYGNYNFSCGIEAGKSLFGKDYEYNNSNNVLMNNAIPLKKFKFNHEKRLEYRNFFSVNNKKILLHVGRFSYEKNHDFLIEVMSKLINNNEQYVLFLVGEGQLLEKTKQMVKDKNISKSIFFLHQRDDIELLMSMSDILLLPSFSEGVPLTLVEGQSSGIKIIASEFVPNEVKVTDLIEFLPLDSDVWVENIMKTNLSKERNVENMLDQSGFSIKQEAKKYENWIIKNLNK